jgi:hypothetical protein
MDLVRGKMSTMMRFVFRSLVICCLLFAGTNSGVSAQTVGASTVTPGGPVTMQVFYRVPPGKREEFLNLYKKYHYPVMNKFVEMGILKSVHIYQRRLRAESPAWDYEVVLVWRDWAAIEEGHVKEPGLITAMYPDAEQYKKADQRRFELTTDVWIDLLEEIDAK